MMTLISVDVLLGTAARHGGLAGTVLQKTAHLERKMIKLAGSRFVR
jgi:hypothetical protein